VKLVDTSVWIDFWRGAGAAVDLARLLEEGEVLLHPWVLGEISLGNLGARRAAILRDLRLLPVAPVALQEEVFSLIKRRALAGSGLGWVDAHLLASAKLAAAELWTSDQRLARAWRAVR
jgi:predicted nucleic acid-binding protein